MIETRHFTDAFFTLFEETFEDPPTPGEGNAYLDAQTAWVQTLADVTAERASRPLVPGGTSIAGHVHHTAYYLELVARFLAGEDPATDWPGSWRTGTVDDATWTALKTRLMDAYARIDTDLRATERWDEDRIGDAMAALAHSAYHLGAVRQMVRLA